MCLNAFGALREQHLVFLGLVCSTYQPLVAFPCVEQALSGSTYLLHPRAGGFARFFYPAPEQGPALGQGTFLEQDRSILPQKRDLPWGRGLFWGRSGIYLSIEPHLDPARPPR